jgi:hypothetical protein
MPITFPKKLGVIVLLLSAGAARAGALRGHATDVTGAAVGGAYVFAYDNQKHVAASSSKSGKATTTKRDGSFLLDLAPGFHDVCVFSPGFTASCQKILMSSANHSDYEVKLAVDPLVIKERGDNFFTP